MESTKMVTVGAVDLFIREMRTKRSPKPPLVVIHGGPDWDHTYLLPGLVPVAGHRHVILFDMRGCGLSTRDLASAEYQPEFVVEDIAGLVAALGHERVDLLGFSTGGQVAQLLIEARPDLVRRLILASTTAYAQVEPYLEGWTQYQRRRHWARVLTELKNRGVQDVLMLVCDGLKGLPDAVNTVWPATIVQACVVHLLRNSFRYASKRDWPELAKDLKPIYTAPSDKAAQDLFAEFSDKWQRRYPAVIRLWTDAWAEFVPFLEFDSRLRPGRSPRRPRLGARALGDGGCLNPR